MKQEKPLDTNWRFDPLGIESALLGVDITPFQEAGKAIQGLYGACVDAGLLPSPFRVWVARNQAAKTRRRKWGKKPSTLQ